MKSKIYPKLYTPVVINNYEVVEEHQHTTTPHSGETCDEKLPDHLARFSSTQFESLKHFHLYDTWKRKTSEEDKIWTPINILKHSTNRNNQDGIHTIIKTARDHNNMIADHMHDHNLQDIRESLH